MLCKGRRARVCTPLIAGPSNGTLQTRNADGATAASEQHRRRAARSTVFASCSLRVCVDSRADGRIPKIRTQTRRDCKSARGGQEPQRAFFARSPLSQLSNFYRCFAVVALLSEIVAAICLLLGIHDCTFVDNM